MWLLTLDQSSTSISPSVVCIRTRPFVGNDARLIVALFLSQSLVTRFRLIIKFGNQFDLQPPVELKFVKYWINPQVNLIHQDTV